MYCLYQKRSIDSSILGINDTKCCRPLLLDKHTHSTTSGSRAELRYAAQNTDILDLGKTMVAWQCRQWQQQK